MPRRAVGVPTRPAAEPPLVEIRVLRDWATTFLASRCEAHRHTGSDNGLLADLYPQSVCCVRIAAGQTTILQRLQNGQSSAPPARSRKSRGDCVAGGLNQKRGNA